MQNSIVPSISDEGKIFDETIGQFIESLKNKLIESLFRLGNNQDYIDIEKELNSLMNSFSASLLCILLNNCLQDEGILNHLKIFGGKLGMHFIRYREITVRLINGQEVRVMSPYFVKAAPKKGRKRKKKGPRGRKGQGHLGLRVYGFIGLCSGNIVSEIVKLAVLCPSIQVAEQVLAERGIFVDTKTFRRLAECLGELGLENRARISLDGKEHIEGFTLVIGIDGGRLRIRTAKRGKIKENQKRRGYRTDWKEPNLFTIYLMDENGNIVRDFKPLHDATMNKKVGLFDLLKKYLTELDVSRVERIVFTGDGAPDIWSGVEKLSQECGLSELSTYQVLDYTHAKQNLNDIISLIPKSINKKKKEKKIKQWGEFLWQGNIQGLYNSICDTLKGKNKKSGLKKWNNYFLKNEKRMQYSYFKSIKIPCGSGCVESAIRRVINLRLKSPGIFWKNKMAEYFLFLRSQLISGRWSTFIRNAVTLLKTPFCSGKRRKTSFHAQELKA